MKTKTQLSYSISAVFIGLATWMLITSYLRNDDLEKRRICQRNLSIITNAIVIYDAEKRSDGSKEFAFPPTWSSIDSFTPIGLPRRCPCGEEYIFDPKNKCFACPLGVKRGHVFISNDGTVFDGQFRSWGEWSSRG